MVLYSSVLSEQKTHSHLFKEHIAVNYINFSSFISHLEQKYEKLVTTANSCGMH